ncbi:hypothetical protein CREGCYN_04480 [Synechococcus sp. M16CYN]
MVIALFSGFLLGSATTSVAGVLSQMDPVAALIVVLGSELTMRRIRKRKSQWMLLEHLLNLSRIGFLYGLFLEAFKLI